MIDSARIRESTRLTGSRQEYYTKSQFWCGRVADSFGFARILHVFFTAGPERSRRFFSGLKALVSDGLVGCKCF
jgi:hypothetical protein